MFGTDSKQIGMVTDEELDLLYRETAVLSGGTALDLGFGAGFVAERISREQNMRITGINIDEDEVSFAKEHYADNDNLAFLQMDFTEMSFPDGTKFDLIYSFDTLYFAETVENLNKLLDTCMNLLNPDGVLAIFWTNMPKPFPFPMESPNHEFTQVGLWARKKNIPYTAYDLTERHRKFWIEGLKALTNLEEEFRAENYEYYDEHIKEYKLVNEFCTDGSLYRWLFIFRKPA
jgi:SAM-dependent methyltransferase